MENQKNAKVVKKQKFPYYIFHTVHDPLIDHIYKHMQKQDPISRILM